MTNTLRPEALIATARRLAESQGQGRPLQTDLRRAVSTAYYGLFHTLARECADAVVGKANRLKIRKAWAQVYRSLDHGRVRNVCAGQNTRIKQAYRRFPASIRVFGDTFVAMQAKRHQCDYDPLMPLLLISGVVGDIDTAEKAISDFMSAAPLDRRAFCAFVLHDLRA